MHPTFRSYLEGTLVSRPREAAAAQLKNALPLPLYVSYVDDRGRVRPVMRKDAPLVLTPDQEYVDLDTNVGTVFVFTTVGSGAIAAVLTLEEGIQLLEVTPEILTAPNDIGPLPKPHDKTMIPTDSPRVLVACGIAQNGNLVTREQFWMRMPDSYCLAPGTVHTVGFTSTFGKQQVTTEQSQVSTALSMSASAGWGPISASVSASLNTSSSTSQQFTISEETTRYESIVLENKTDRTQMFLKWQLTDVVNVVSKDDARQVLASIVMATPPVLISGPFDPNDPPPRAGVTTLTPQASATRAVVRADPKVKR